jgi:hypothetical protein
MTAPNEAAQDAINRAAGNLRLIADNYVWPHEAASDAAAELVALVAEAESAALTEHVVGTCHVSEWSCSYCEAESS